MPHSWELAADTTSTLTEITSEDIHKVAAKTIN